MIASLYPMEESKTDIESGFIKGNLVAVKVDDHNFVCGKSRIRIYDQHGIRRTYEKWIDFGWTDRKKEIEILRANNQRLEKENDVLRKDLFKALMRLKAYEENV